MVTKEIKSKEEVLKQLGYDKVVVWMAHAKTPTKYERAYSTYDKKVVVKYVHRLVWEYFHGPIPKGYIIRHRDGNKLNNEIDNLECLSRAEHCAKHRQEKPLFRGNQYYYADGTPRNKTAKS